MGISVGIPSVAVDRLEKKAGRKRRKKKHRRGDPFPIEPTRSGGGKKSKRKGASFEKVIAKQFAAYYGCSVRRTPGSGGWATVGDFGPRGDLVFASRKAPYHVECKKHEGWDLSDLLTGLRGLNTTCTNSIAKWWQQTIRDCPKKKAPMLIFARNRTKVGRSETVGVEPLLMMREENLRWLYSKSLRPKDELAHIEHYKMIRHFELSVDDIVGSVWVLTLADFFKYIRPPKSSPRRKLWKHGVG